MKRIYRYSKKRFQASMPGAYRILNKRKTIVKYIISGGTAAVTDLILLYLFTEVLKIHYLLSSSLAFIIAFFISFYLQKFWTFRDNNREKMYQQMSLYLAVGIVNLAVNAGGMYVLVEHVLPNYVVAGIEITYILSQIIMGAFIAVFSFLIYRFVIFKKLKSKPGESKSNNNFKILIATGIFPPDIGGPATYTKTLCEELPKLGCELKVITYGDGIQNVHLVSRGQNLFFRYFKYFWQVFKLCGWADVVYVQGPVSEGLPSWLACKLRGKKYVLKIVGDYAWEQGTQRFGVKELLDNFQDKKYCWQVELMRKIQRLVTRGARKIVTPSEYLKKIVNRWGADNDKINVIYNSVKKIDLSISKEEAKSELNMTGNIILSVGRLVPWKGFACLIELMPKLLKLSPNFKLIIAGEGPMAGSLKSEIENLGLEKYVYLIGSVEQEKLWQYMRAADMFVLNTGYEGLPHVVLEAMHIGLPVIVSRVGGNPETVEHGVSGLLVEYNNKEQIKNAILYIWQDKDKGERLANNAKASLDKFNKQAMINNTIQILKQSYENN